METVRDGLYFIHFQPPLSALQSFSIAVAIIHIRSPTLRPKKLRELKYYDPGWCLFCICKPYCVIAVSHNFSIYI
ncbi:hypothetical protein ACB092_08G114900 [Castanea dentata]